MNVFVYGLSTFGIRFFVPERAKASESRDDGVKETSPSAPENPLAFGPKGGLAAPEPQARGPVGQGVIRKLK